MSDPLRGPFGEDDEEINICREGAFLGTFRIRLDNIALPAFSNRETRHVRRLEDIFQIQGCFRLDPRNRAEATIDSVTWGHVSARSSPEMLSHRIPQELHLSLEETVSCFSGKCRLAAAKGVLKDRARWWPVSIYRVEASEALVQYHVHSSSHEKIPPNGLNYCESRRQYRRNNAHRGNQLLKNLTLPMEKRVRRLWTHHRQLTRGFDQCVRWRNLWHDVHLGVLHKIIASKCEEECLRYLASITTFWDRISDGSRLHVSEEMVTLLQGRCPTFSERDRLYLQSLVDSNQVMTHLTQEQKAHVLRECVQYGLTIPSLFTFFEDFKYIALCSKALRKLRGDEQLGRRASLRAFFKGKFVFRGETTIQTGRETFVTVPYENQEDAFDWIYSQLWLCSMRLWPFILEDRPRKREKGSRDSLQGTDPTPYIVELAHTARSLGLSSLAIDRLANGHLPAAYGAGLSHHGFIVNRGVPRYNLAERCGVPYDDATAKDLHSLYINSLLDSTELVPGTDITILLVRRAFFQRLFPESARIQAAVMHVLQSAEGTDMMGQPQLS